jgi:hypothetical protein
MVLTEVLTITWDVRDMDMVPMGRLLKAARLPLTLD